MTRSVSALVLVVAIAAGCAAAPQPAPSVDAIASTRETPANAGRPPASAAATSSTAAASVEPERSAALPSFAPFPVASPAAGVPPELQRFAWTARRREDRANGGALWHVSMGLLGEPVAFTLDVPSEVGVPRVASGGGLVAVAVSDGRAVRVSTGRAGTGQPLTSVTLPGTDVRPMVVDGVHGLVYVAVGTTHGGVEIRRLGVDLASADVILTLDKRFTPDGMPTERFDLTLDPDGVLIVEACGNADGCRLWEIPRGAATAPKPRTLPGRPPIVCSIVAADRDWLVVQDDEACWADTSEAALPVRAIHRSDGASHVITRDHVGLARLLDVGGRTVVAGVDPIYAGATVDVVTYDVETGRPTRVVRGIKSGPDDVTPLMAATSLPAPWVLLQPWFVEAPALPSINARLVNLETSEQIELPPGTFGWT